MPLLPTDRQAAENMVSQTLGTLGSVHSGATLTITDGNSFSINCGVISVFHHWDNGMVAMWVDFHDRRTAFIFQEHRVEISGETWTYLELEKNSDLGEMWEWLGVFEIFEQGRKTVELRVHQLDQRYEENLHTNAHEYWTMLREKLL